MGSQSQEMVVFVELLDEKIEQSEQELKALQAARAALNGAAGPVKARQVVVAVKPKRPYTKRTMRGSRRYRRWHQGAIQAVLREAGHPLTKTAIKRELNKNGEAGRSHNAVTIQLMKEKAEGRIRSVARGIYTAA